MKSTTILLYYALLRDRERDTDGEKEKQSKRERM
jgi:hypothetical protein